ncbi:PfkB family carbohydrate kinase [Methanobrevibacter sp.]|uniref:PfkB family carbohydrate kinase n=1 Tax=Methanobrevibacter sp. TaxID=66852 RepID=UPI00388E3D17
MTLVVIGPVTKDEVIIESECKYKVGGATYFQSFVFEEFYEDYLAIVNCSDSSLIDEFPDLDKVRVILKDETHFFINEYPDGSNMDIRHQLSNFANIPILKGDLESILPDDIDAFVLNPLNRYDFPLETIEFLKSFNVPIFISIQGFLRLPDVKVNENYTIKLDNFAMLSDILRGVTSIFLDEAEANIIGTDFDVDEMVVTNGSLGSRIVSDNEIKIDAVKCDNVVDTTGCGDTFMAAYVSDRLCLKSAEKSAEFASLIASEKIHSFGPYNSEK